MTAPAFLSPQKPTVQCRPDGIMCVDYGHSPALTGAGVLEVVRRRLEISPEAMPVMVKLTGRPTMDASLPDALRCPTYCQITSAVAYVTDSWYVRNLINTYLTVQKPPYPLFVFADEQDAITCLRRYVSTGDQGE